MRWQNKNKIFLGFVFSFLILICFCHTTQAKNRSIIIPPPNPMRPINDHISLESKIIFEWQKVIIPPEYSLKYYILEVTPNISGESADFSHGLSLKILVDGNNTRFPPTGDGYEASKIATDTSGRFAWRVQSIYNCGEEEEKSQPSIQSTNYTELDSTIMLYDFGDQFYESTVFSKYGKPIYNLDEGKGKRACKLINGKPMVNLDFVMKYLGGEYSATWTSQKLTSLSLTRYKQTIDIDNTKSSNNSMLAYASGIDMDPTDGNVFPLYLELKKQFDSLSIYYYKDDTGASVIYLNPVILKWIGVNYIKFDSANNILRICDQGLKEGKKTYAWFDGGPKGKYYIVPKSFSEETYYSSSPYPLNTSVMNRLSIKINDRFKLWCVGSSCSELCGGDTILRVELLEGIAKIIYLWETSSHASTQNQLKISGSYRCKVYNDVLYDLCKAIKDSSHQIGLKVDLDLNYPDGQNLVEQNEFVSFCNTHLPVNGLFKTAEQGVSWADLLFNCGSDGPWFKQKMDNGERKTGCN
jgi:hypothetical protein